MPQELLETWMLLEYADRGSLEQAVKAKRFVRRPSSQLDMVRPLGVCHFYSFRRWQ